VHIKFTKAGKRTAKGLAVYLLQEKNSRGAVRHEIKVLQGDPYRVAQTADSLGCKDTFTHGIISWGPEDEPTEQQKGSLLDHFKRLAFGGLDETRFAFAFVEHQEKDKGRHIHFFQAKVDLQSGFKYNPAPPQKGRFGYFPSWQKSYDALRDIFNFDCNWARPDDPRRMRDISLEIGHYATEGKVFTERASVKIKLCEIVREGIRNGTIRTREHVLDKLRKYGTITRVVNNSISISLQGYKKSLRLKGYLFSKDFDVAKRIDIDQAPKLSQEERAARKHAANIKFKEELYKKNNYNIKRYGCNEKISLPNQCKMLIGTAIFREKIASLDSNFPKLVPNNRPVEKDDASTIRLFSQMAVYQHVNEQKQAHRQSRQVPPRQHSTTHSFWWEMGQNKLKQQKFGTTEKLSIFLEQLLLTSRWKKSHRTDIPFNTIMVEAEPGKWTYLMVYPDDYSPEAIFLIDENTLGVLDDAGTPEGLKKLRAFHNTWLQSSKSYGQKTKKLNLSHPLVTLSKQHEADRQDGNSHPKNAVRSGEPIHKAYNITKATEGRDTKTGRFKDGNKHGQGRPPGLQNRITRQVRELLTAEAEELTRALITKAKAGDVAALKVIFSRLVPPVTTEPLDLLPGALPEIEKGSDYSRLVLEVFRLVVEGHITTKEAAEVLDLGQRAKTAANNLRHSFLDD
jgi:hypothetical protein